MNVMVIDEGQRREERGEERQRAIDRDRAPAAVLEARVARRGVAFREQAVE